MASIIGVETLQHTNGTTGLTIDSSGRVNQPNGVFTYVQLTTSNAQDTVSPYTTTGTDIRFDNIKVNKSSSYTASNGRFTAPVAGVYRLSISFLKSNTSAACYFTILKNGSDTNIRGYSDVNEYAPMFCEAFFDLAANDYLTVQLVAGEINITGINDGQYNHTLFELVG